MNIALWNIQRASMEGEPSKLKKFQPRVSGLDSYIIILTEASLDVLPPFRGYNANSRVLKGKSYDTLYKGGPIEYFNEVRTRIISRYPILAQHDVKDPLTNCCVDIETDSGIIRVLACIVGVIIDSEIKDRDYKNLCEDLEKFAAPNMILAGDFNWIGPNKSPGIFENKLRPMLAANRLSFLTDKGDKLCDHVAVGSDFEHGGQVFITSIANMEKGTSDHSLVEIRNVSLLMH
jgi:hypothetical protein